MLSSGETRGSVPAPPDRLVQWSASITRRIRIVPAGWPGVISTGSRSTDSRSPYSRAVICASMYSPMNAGDTSRG